MRSKCVSMNRASFKRLLGKLDRILKRNMQQYEGLVQQGLIDTTA